MAPPHVLHVSHAVNTGLAHCVADYVAAQREHGARVTVACPGGRLGALAASHGADVVEWHAVRQPGVGVLAEAARLRRILGEVAPDVVHLHCAKAGLVGRAVVRGRIPTVFSPHAWSFFAVNGLMRRAVLGWERLGMRWTDAVSCVSAAERDTGRAHGLRGRMEVLPNEVAAAAVEATRAESRALARRALDAALGGALAVHRRAGGGPSAARGVPVAVCSARLARQKGQDVLVAAWPAVRATVPDAVLVLVGDGPARRSLEAAAGEGVYVVGAVERETALRYMHAADLVVCPSRWEGMSLVPLEAMALGRPVVVTAVDGMAEVVPPAAGRIVPSDDVAALAEAVAMLLDDPVMAAAVGRAGREHTLRTAGPSSASRLMALYEELTGRVPVPVA